jgi:hypothetical protein
MFDAIGVAALIDSSPERLTPTVMVSILGMPGSWGVVGGIEYHKIKVVIARSKESSIEL